MYNAATDSVSRGVVAPVSPGERVQALDVLRGLALLGILVVNILDYAPTAKSGAERLTVQLIDVFADGSFYPLFSLLFGVGFAVFLDRAAARGGSGVILYVRRLLALLVIAVLQFVLLEDRNILVRYAFLALPLLLFWRASARVCFGAALLCFGLAIARGPIDRTLALRTWRDPVTAAVAREQLSATRAQNQAQRAEHQRVDATHSFAEYASYRAGRVLNVLSWSIDLRRNPSLLHILAMFLLGAAAWRARVFSQPTFNRRLHRRILVWGALAGVAGNLAVVQGLAGNLAVVPGPIGGPLGPLTARSVLTTAITLTADTALTLAYVAGMMLLLYGGRAAWHRCSAALAVVGRMGLTNYLWQSVAMSLLFLPYGLRLDGKLPVRAYPLIGVIIFASHLPLSTWWLARYRFGPAEWLWRTATYGRLQPMRLLAAGATAETQA